MNVQSFKYFLISDNRFKHWQTQQVPLRPGLELFVVEAEEGGPDFYSIMGDICVDDFEVEVRDCRHCNVIAALKLNEKILYFHNFLYSGIRICFSLFAASSDIYGLYYKCDFEQDTCGAHALGVERAFERTEPLTGPDSGAGGSGTTITVQSLLFVCQ